MPSEENKALFARLIDEFFNRGNNAVADEMFASNFVEHEQLPGGIPGTADGVKQMNAMFRAAFPDFKVRVDDLIAEGDQVVARTTWSGTQRGEFMGVPPTGKSVSFGVIDIVRFANGKVTEHWGQMDAMGMMMQLGAIPAPGQGAA